MHTILNKNAQAVLEAVRATKNHPTALDVYQTVRRVRPHIGLATVYRALHQLSRAGLVKEIGHRDGCCRYDANTSRHDHAVCTACGTLFDLPTTANLSAIDLQAAAQQAGIELDSYELRIYGRCSACQRSNS